jgi:hypothetical protein
VEQGRLGTTTAGDCTAKQQNAFHLHRPSRAPPLHAPRTRVSFITLFRLIKVIRDYLEAAYPGSVVEYD